MTKQSYLVTVSQGTKILRKERCFCNPNENASIWNPEQAVLLEEKNNVLKQWIIFKVMESIKIRVKNNLSGRRKSCAALCKYAAFVFGAVSVAVLIFMVFLAADKKDPRLIPYAAFFWLPFAALSAGAAVFYLKATLEYDFVLTGFSLLIFSVRVKSGGKLKLDIALDEIVLITDFPPGGYDERIIKAYVNNKNIFYVVTSPNKPGQSLTIKNMAKQKTGQKLFALEIPTRFLSIISGLNPKTKIDLTKPYEAAI